MTRVHNLVSHDFVAHPDDIKNSWNQRNLNLISNKILLYLNNLVGYASYSQGQGKNSKTTFFDIKLDPKVDSKYHELLYEKILSEVKSFNCNKLVSNIFRHPNYTNLEALLKIKGFKLVQTNKESSCIISEVNTEKYLPLIEKLESQEIIFYNSKNDMKKFPKHYENLEELYWICEKDIPIPDGIELTRDTFEEFMKDFSVE